KEILLPRGIKEYSIRIDSGDLTYLSKEARKMLDQADLKDCTITVSNSLDERIIKDLLIQGAQIDVFGVGERLITAKSEPVFGSVYKLAAIEENNKIIPKIKISDNIEKITTPHFKTIYRIVDKDGHFEADLITVFDETIDETRPLTIFDPVSTWKEKTFEDYTLIKMHQLIYKGGKRVYDKPSIQAVRVYAQKQLKSLWPELRRFDFPHRYYVDLSKKLWMTKDQLINHYKQGGNYQCVT
ncbi:MAG TPA: hypothetical protein VJ878_03735, partial [Candidatus Izemoplasmatales bacterium]|nr:hypothetical protein [Candidatus Izemoplasmatales bacterium]